MIADSFRRADMCSFVGSYMLLLMVVAAAVSSVCIGAVRMRLLWLSIICFVLFMQL